MGRPGCIVALLLLAAALTGCQSVEGTSQYTQVRYIDASPDAPALDVYQGSALSLYSVGFGSVSSYIPVASGGYSYSVDVSNTQQQLATVRGTFTLGNQYTVLVGNTAANLQMTVLQDGSVPAPSGQIAFRFLDQAIHAGAVDIYLVPPSGTLSTTLPILTRVTFNNVPIYIDVPFGAYSIVVLPTGTSTSATSSAAGATATTNVHALYSGSEISYPAASVRTIVLLDQPLVASPSVTVVTADDYDSPSAI
jgi:hypothetical protein